MSISESERAYRRRLLYSAMPEDASTQTVQKSLAVLDNEFGEVAEMKYSQLVQRLQQNLDQAELDIAKLLGNLMTLKKKPAGDLRPDPETAGGLSNAGSTAAASTVRLEGRLKVFNTLFESIARNVEKRGKIQAFQEHMAFKADSLQISGVCAETLAGWVQSDGLSPTIGGGNAELQRVVNEAFVWLCDAFGPTDADKVLLQGVKAAEATPEAFECSPRVFL